MVLRMGKIPRWFVTAYLKAKGWREPFHFNCDCNCEELFQPEHPIRFLWEHVEKGHKPSFDMAHSWDRQIGRGLWAKTEPWYGWWIATWNPEKKLFDVEVEEKGRA